MNIKQYSVHGEPFPDFLIEHVEHEWRGVEIQEADPDICLKVDSGLSYCGCIFPSIKLRQFVYLYHQSNDFDHQTIALLVRVFEVAGDDADIWDELIALEFERDCGLERLGYLERLAEMAEYLEQMTDPEQALRIA